MIDVFLIEMDDEGASTYYVVDEITFAEAVDADDEDEGLMNWFPDEHDWPTFHAPTDLIAYLRDNDMCVADEVKGFFF